mmetsp:Transcript_8718/g.13019  ORF Transcript_8718/g.13019 Transcript_8718/m.13019 type:complete len:739 (+) Transcript_8718:66-2282(+)
MAPLGDDTEKEFSTEYDYVAVFPVKENGRMTNTADFFMKRVKQRGFETFSYLSVQKNELFVLLRCPMKKLEVYADAINFRLQLDPTVSREMCEAGFPESNIAPIHITDDRQYSSMSPYEFIYGKFDTSLPKEIYYHTERLGHPFKRSVRLKLTYYLLQAPGRFGGCNLRLEKMLANKQMLAMYPNHQKHKLKKIEAEWVKWYSIPWRANIDILKEYFGEKIALYFLFMTSYTRLLILPGILGLIFQIIVWRTGNWSHPVLPFYSVMINIWVIVLLELWKRRQKQMSLEWGTMGFEAEEPERPDFKGKRIKSYIDGQDILYFSPFKRDCLLFQSTAVINTLVLVVVGFVSAIYVLRFQLYTSIGGNASIVASALNSIQIVIFNMIYNWVARQLTIRENHRTATSFDDSMIAKLFIFQFVNSYASFYFLAFVAPYVPRPPQLDDDGPQGDYVGECGNADCMVPLSTNLGIIFFMNLTVNNFVELLTPYIYNARKVRENIEGTEAEEAGKKGIRRAEKEAKKIMTPPEEQYLLQEYDVSMAVLKEYAETAVQFGLMTVFISALPIATFVAMIYNFVEIKVDAWKLISFFQRPIPKVAEDWGAWQEVFTAIAIVSVVTNAGLVCFTMQCLDGFKLSTRIWIFVGYQWVMFVLMYLVAYLIPDESREFTIQKERTDFIVSKLIDRVPDEADDEMAAILEMESPRDQEGRGRRESAIEIQQYPGSSSVDHDAADSSQVLLSDQA